jgi:putative hydrolase of the HAD superfamily
MKYKYLLFDLDGTLFDYDYAEAQALKQTFFEFGIQYEDNFLEVYRKINHAIWNDFEAGKITQEKIKIKRFSELAHELELNYKSSNFSDSYLTNLSKGTHLIPGAEKTISKLSKKAELALITNGLTMVQKPRIGHSTIGQYFKLVVISEEIGYAKPGKEIFDHTLDKLDNPDKKDVLMIGDSLSSDITGGVNYGIATCWFNPKKFKRNEHPKPDYEIESLNDLLHIV